MKKASRRAKCPCCHRAAPRRYGAFSVHRQEAAKKHAVEDSPQPRSARRAGIAIEDSTDIELRDNIVIGFDAGIVAENSKNVRIIGGDYSQTRHGVVNKDSEVDIEGTSL